MTDGTSKERCLKRQIQPNALKNIEPHYGGSRMADILTIIAAVEWMALGLLVLWKLKGWDRKMEELYEDMKKQWEAEHETS